MIVIEAFLTGARGGDQTEYDRGWYDVLGLDQPTRCALH